MSAPTIRSETATVWNGRLNLRVQVAGSGPPVVYLHPAAGLAWDPFLFRLADQRTVFAPEFPGTSPADRGAIHAVDELWDLVLCYEEALRGLGLSGAPVIGPSFGGMLAAELAAGFPSLFSKVVLLDPAGLWREDLPIWNWMTGSPAELPARLFHDLSSPGAKALFAPPANPNAAIAAQAAFVWALGCTGKFLWPIPEKGLHKRIHRISAPTLVVWGENDTLIPSGYAEEFRTRIAGSRVEIIPNCGHVPQVEQIERTWAAVTAFLGL